MVIAIQISSSYRPSPANAFGILRKPTAFLTSIRTNVANDGRINLCLPNPNGTFRPLTLFHDKLHPLADRTVNLVIEFTPGKDPVIQVFVPGKMEKPVFTFYVDKNGPYFLPKFFKDRGAKMYPVELAPIGAKEGSQPKINGITFYRGKKHANTFVYVTTIGGKIESVQNSLVASPRPFYLFPIYGGDHQLTAYSVGDNSMALFANGVTGFTGPVKLTHDCGSGNLRFELENQRYSFSAEDCRALGLGPDERRVWLNLENGIPLQFYGPKDTLFKFPRHLIVVRDENFAPLFSANYRIRERDLGGIKVVEGSKTGLSDNPSKYRYAQEVVNVQGKEHYFYGSDPTITRKTFRHRHLLLVIINNEQVLFYTEGRNFDLEAKAIALLAIRAYKNLASISTSDRKDPLVVHIRKVASEAHAAKKSDDFAAYNRCVAELKKLGSPQSRITARISEEHIIALPPGAFPAIPTALSLMHPAFRQLKIKELELVFYPSQTPPEIAIYSPKDPFVPIYSFFLDGNTPFFIPTAGERLYPAVGDLIEVGGQALKLYKKNSIGEIGPVYLQVKKGVIVGVLDEQLEPVNWLPILNEKRETTGLVIGDSPVAPFEFKISGYFGPITFFLRVEPRKSGEIVSIPFFPYRGAGIGKSYYPPSSALVNLGIDPQKEPREISALFEDGIPVAVYSPQDHEFKNHHPFTTIRNGDGKLISASAGNFLNHEIPEDALIENLRTFFNRSVYFHVVGIAFWIPSSGRKYTRENFEPHFVSTVLARKQFCLFAVAERSFNQTGRKIAVLALAAFAPLSPEKQKEGAKKIRRLAEAAYQAHRAGKIKASNSGITKLKQLAAINKPASATKKAETTCAVEEAGRKAPVTFSAKTAAVTPIKFDITGPAANLATLDFAAFLAEANGGAFRFVKRTLQQLLEQLAEPNINGETLTYNAMRSELRHVLSDDRELNRIYSVLAALRNLCNLKQAILSGNENETTIQIYLIDRKLSEVRSPNLSEFRKAKPKLTAGTVPERLAAFADFCRAII